MIIRGGDRDISGAIHLRCPRRPHRRRIGWIAIDIHFFSRDLGQVLVVNGHDKRLHCVVTAVVRRFLNDPNRTQLLAFVQHDLIKFRFFHCQLAFVIRCSYDRRVAKKCPRFHGLAARFVTLAFTLLWRGRDLFGHNFLQRARKLIGIFDGQ